MNHLLLELMPFLAGCTYGLIVRWRGLKGFAPCLLLGPLCSWFAGELGHDAVETAFALTFDTVAALVGCALARYGLRLAGIKKQP